MLLKYEYYIGETGLWRFTARIGTLREVHIYADRIEIRAYGIDPLGEPHSSIEISAADTREIHIEEALLNLCGGEALRAFDMCRKLGHRSHVSDRFRGRRGPKMRAKGCLGIEVTDPDYLTISAGWSQALGRYVQLPDYTVRLKLHLNSPFSFAP